MLGICIFMRNIQISSFNQEIYAYILGEYQLQPLRAPAYEINDDFEKRIAVILR